MCVGDEYHTSDGAAIGRLRADARAGHNPREESCRDCESCNLIFELIVDRFWMFEIMFVKSSLIHYGRCVESVKREFS